MNNTTKLQRIQQRKIMQAEAREAVERFFYDCMYVEEEFEAAEAGIPALVVYFIWLEWQKNITPDVRLTFAEFNAIFKDFAPHYAEFRDSDGISAWLNMDLTKIAHAYLSMSPMAKILPQGGNNESG
jgi:hypothetical protein